MKKALVVGGNSGIGLALSLSLIDKGYDHLYIVGKEAPRDADIPEDKLTEFKSKTSVRTVNLVNQEYDVLSDIDDIDTLIITVGFGRVAQFERLTDTEIANLVKCNMMSVMRIVKHYYAKIQSTEDFYCAIMGSIAGHIASPMFSAYGATKAGLCAFIENLNIELEFGGYSNRILDVSPGSLKGTSFNGGKNDVSLIADVADNILAHMWNKESVYIPQYDEIYAGVIDRYIEDPHKFGIESCEYKINSGRLSDKPQVVVGYLSGTFDLFHIGHLNLLRRAKQYCDYLIVGVHESGSWKGKQTFIPFEERLAIVESVKYVDKATKSFTEDSDAYDALHYDRLFVGSDYKGSERFQRYEEYFKDKGVEIIYFSYTQGTSSTQLRDAISKK